MKRLLTLALVIFGLANVTRAVLATQQMAQLSPDVTDIPPGYLAAVSVAWAIVFGIAAYGIARSRRWAPRVTIAAIVLYQANLWLDRLAFYRSGEATERIGFAVLLSALSIVIIVGASLRCERQIRNSTPDTRHST